MAACCGLAKGNEQGRGLGPRLRRRTHRSGDGGQGVCLQGAAGFDIDPERVKDSLANVMRKHGNVEAAGHD